MAHDRERWGVGLAESENARFTWAQQRADDVFFAWWGFTLAYEGSSFMPLGVPCPAMFYAVRENGEK